MESRGGGDELGWMDGMKGMEVTFVSMNGIRVVNRSVRFITYGYSKIYIAE